jgi:hypothetical protein
MHPGRILLAAALCLSACTNAEPPPTEYSVAMDPAFTDDQTEALVAAFENWKTAVPELKLTYAIAACTSPAPQQVCVHPVTAPPDASMEIIGETYPGPSASANVYVFVDRMQPVGEATSESALMQQTMAHELGHAMGMRHTAAGTLMAANAVQQSPTVTADDVAQFWSVRGK